MVCPYCGSASVPNAQKCSACHEWIDLEHAPPWAGDLQTLWRVVFDYARSQKATGRGTGDDDMAGLGHAVYAALAQLTAEGKGPPWLRRIPPQ